MQERQNNESVLLPQSEMLKAEIREWLESQLAISPFEAKHQGIYRALDRAAQAILELRILTSGVPLKGTQ